MVKRDPKQFKNVLLHANNVVKYMPIDKSAMDLFNPILDFTPTQFLEENENINKPKVDVHENGYLNNISKIHPHILELFQHASLVIHPSLFTKQHYDRYFPIENTIVQIHNDIMKMTEELVVPKIFDKNIYIGCIQELSHYKGYENVTLLKNKYTHYNDYKIHFLIVGKTIPKYTEENWESFVKRYQFHCLLHLNKYGETYSYCLTKSLITGLPILYNNIGAYKERIPPYNKHYLKVIEKESDYSNQELLFSKFESMLNYIIENNRYSREMNKSKYICHPFYDALFDKNRFTFRPGIENNIVLILTSTVQINPNISVLYQKNINERIYSYMYSIKKWLTKTQFKIVMVENSGYPFTELDKEKNIFKDRFEYITYKESDLQEATCLVNNKSKGTSEIFSIDYALRHSNIVKESGSPFIIKITARYFVPDLESYLNYHDLQEYDCLTQYDPNRCEIVGCQYKHVSSVFHLNIINEKGEKDEHIENVYKYRTSLYDNLFRCKKFPIEKTIRGGGPPNNSFYIDL
jgi:hypothetical protein